MKYYGQIGFADAVETSLGVWDDDIVEKNYYGDVLQNSLRYQNGTGVVDNVNVSNRFSIVIDSYIQENLHKIRYIVWQDTMWEVTNVDVQYPRLIISIGGVYNGDRGPSTKTT